MARLAAQEVAGEVRMLRTNWYGPVMLVEGPNDVKLFQAFYDDSLVKIIPAYGWENVRDAKHILDCEHVEDVLCVIDLDYKGILEQLLEDQDTFTTDSHDIETMLIDSSALRKVLIEHGSKSKIEAWPRGVTGVRECAYGVALKIAAVRFYNEKNKLGLCFEELDYPKFIDRHSLSFKVEVFIGHLRGKWPPNKEISFDTLEEVVGDSSNVLEFTDHSLFCCGHDVAEIIAIGLRSVWGSKSAKALAGQQIESLLRLAYSREEFSTTLLARKIEEWFDRRNLIV